MKTWLLPSDSKYTLRYVLTAIPLILSAQIEKKSTIIVTKSVWENFGCGEEIVGWYWGWICGMQESSSYMLLLTTNCNCSTAVWSGQQKAHLPRKLKKTNKKTANSWRCTSLPEKLQLFFLTENMPDVLPHCSCQITRRDVSQMISSLFHIVSKDGRDRITPTVLLLLGWNWPRAGTVMWKHCGGGKKSEQSSNLAVLI